MIGLGLRDISTSRSTRHYTIGLAPWYKGFKGTIERTTIKDNCVSYMISGIIEEINETTLRIIEFPIRKWTRGYKEFLEALMTGNDEIKEPFKRNTILIPRSI